MLDALLAEAARLDHRLRLVVTPKGSLPRYLTLLGLSDASDVYHDIADAVLAELSVPE